MYKTITSSYTDIFACWSFSWTHCITLLWNYRVRSSTEIFWICSNVSLINVIFGKPLHFWIFSSYVLSEPYGSKYVTHCFLSGIILCKSSWYWSIRLREILSFSIWFCCCVVIHLSWLDPANITVSQIRYENEYMSLRGYGLYFWSTFCRSRESILSLCFHHENT